MNHNLSRDLARLLAPEQIMVDLQSFSRGAGTSLLGLLELFDLESSRTLSNAPRIITFDGLAAMSLSESEAFQAGLADHPVFICPGTNILDKDIVVVIKEIVGAEISLCASAPASHFYFEQRSAVWPFSGTCICEGSSRVIPAIRRRRHRHHYASRVFGPWNCIPTHRSRKGSISARCHWQSHLLMVC